MPSQFKLEQVIGHLDHHRQRATYGAFSALFGVQAQSVMKGLPRAPRYSWVVNAQTGRPTGYAELETHPDLERNPKILHSLNELVDWLESVKGK